MTLAINTFSKDDKTGINLLSAPKREVLFPTMFKLWQNCSESPLLGKSQQTSVFISDKGIFPEILSNLPLCL